MDRPRLSGGNKTLTPHAVIDFFVFLFFSVFLPLLICALAHQCLDYLAASGIISHIIPQTDAPVVIVGLPNGAPLRLLNR